VPERIAQQATQRERIYRIDDPPDRNRDGSMILSDVQYQRAKEVMREIFKK
jgi:hypothetical protein